MYTLTDTVYAGKAYRVMQVTFADWVYGVARTDTPGEWRIWFKHTSEDLRTFAGTTSACEEWLPTARLGPVGSVLLDLADAVLPRSTTDAEARGGVAEEVQLIVDGVLEDVKSEHVLTQEAAIRQADAVAVQSKYAADFDRAVELLANGGPQMRKAVVQMAAERLRVIVRTTLRRRPEFTNLKEPK